MTHLAFVGYIDGRDRQRTVVSRVLQVHVEEFESDEGAERTSGRNKNVAALSLAYRCIMTVGRERQTMSHLMTCGGAPKCTWTSLAMPTHAGVNRAKHWEESV